MNTIKEIKLNKTIKGFKVPVLVRIGYEYEVHNPKAGDDFDFGNADDNQDYESKFETGQLSNVNVFVEAFIEGERGMDCLGACHVKSRQIDEDILEYVKDHGMIENAIQEATSVVLSKSAQLARFSLN